MSFFRLSDMAARRRATTRVAPAEDAARPVAIEGRDEAPLRFALYLGASSELRISDSASSNTVGSEAAFVYGVESSGSLASRLCT